MEDITLNTIVASYYESMSYYNEVVNNLRTSGFGFDLTFQKNVENIKKFGFPKNLFLQTGIISGKDPFKANLNELVFCY